MISTQKCRNTKIVEINLAAQRGGQTQKPTRGFSRLNFLSAFALSISFVFFSVADSDAQARKAKTKVPAKKARIVQKKVAVSLPKVTQIDETALKNLLKPNGKPLLINFWATWCVPCQEEFPDLVKIGVDYKDKVDLITISLDELSEINGDVPKFLAEMKAEMPAYLLKTPSEESAIAAVSKDWQGGLPFTILYNAGGETAYIKQGKFETALLRAEIEKTFTVQTPAANLQTLELPKNDFFSDLNYEKGIADAKKDVAKGKLIVRRYGLTASIAPESLEELKVKYNIEYVEHGCLVTRNLIEYVKGYNEISNAEIKRKYGDKVF